MSHRTATRLGLTGLVLLTAVGWQPTGAAAAVSLVQKSNLVSGSGTSLAAALPSATTAGTLVVAMLMDLNSNCSTDTIAGPSGWIKAAHVCRGTSGPLELWYLPNAAGGTTSYTFTTGSAGANMVAQLSEWSGVATTSPLDQSGTTSSASSSTALTVSTSGSITAGGELALTAFATSAGLSSFTPGTGWTSLRTSPGNGFDADYLLGPTNGATLTETATSNPQTTWAAIVVTFRAACAGGTLSLTTAPTATFPTVTLAGYDTTSTLAVAVTLDDQTGSGAGWHLTGTSTTLTNGSGQALPTTATTITAASASAATGNCSLPTNTVTYPVTLPAASTPPTPVTLYRSTATNGSGPSTITLTSRIAIPANARAGIYTATWTLSLSSGP